MSRKNRNKGKYDVVLAISIILLIGLTYHFIGTYSVTGKEVPHIIISKNLTAQSGTIDFSDVPNIDPLKIYGAEWTVYSYLQHEAYNPVIVDNGVSYGFGGMNTYANADFSDLSGCSRYYHFSPPGKLYISPYTYEPQINYSISATGGLVFSPTVTCPLTGTCYDYCMANMGGGLPSKIDLYMQVECVNNNDCGAGRNCTNNLCGAYNANNTIYIYVDSNCTVSGHECPTGMTCMGGGLYCLSTNSTSVYVDCTTPGYECPSGYNCTTMSGTSGQHRGCLGVITNGTGTPNPPDQTNMYILIGIIIFLSVIIVVLLIKRKS